MLRFLNIANLAVIDSLGVEFQPGLNVLSGETGSGKSIIIDALGILLGDRFSPDMIRTGETRAFVEGIFDFRGNDPLIELLDESGVEAGEQEVVIRRETSVGGRGRIFVNNQAATIGLLKAMQPHLIDIHGQGDQQSLLSADAHLNLLDAFASTFPQRQKVASIYQELLDKAKELGQSRQNESERLQSLDMVDFQFKEIEAANIAANEDVELESERIRLANAEKLATLCSEAYCLLYDDEASVLTRLGQMQKRITDLADVDTSFTPHLESVATVKYALDDIAFFLSDYADNIQASPERLKFVEERLIEIDRLKRKYGGSVESILATREKLAERREALLNSEERGRQIEQELQALLDIYDREAEKLSKQRRAAATKFEKAVSAELSEVALGVARFSIRFSRPQNNQLGALASVKADLLSRAGKETAEFFFSANPGEETRSLRLVASGGELSRLMLVLKTVTAPKLFPRTLIFDEIDSGIGGKVSEAVGQRLKRLAGTNQVLCVTHQSQIAKYADAHFVVAKEFTKDRTMTRVTSLDNEGRIEELIRMIGGDVSTPAARKHARELLKSQ
jgi:DNA repair protein RecN (Recombination protein N)